MSIGVTVGATPTSTYQHLAELSRRGIANLADAHFMVFDEFFPHKTLDYESYAAQCTDDTARPPSPHFNQLSEVLFEPARIPSNRIHRPDGNMAPSEALAQFKELVEVHRPDVLVIGVGTNGVVGWNENDTTLTLGAHEVDISFSTEVCNQGYKQCVTLGPDDILKAKEIFLLAAARNKAELIHS